MTLPEKRPYPGPPTITELAAQLDVGRPVVYRLVTALEAHHLVTRRPDGRVRLGLGRRLAHLGDDVARLLKGNAAALPGIELVHREVAEVAAGVADIGDGELAS